MVMVSSPSRIHITLLDLCGDLGRVDGGVGFAVKLPRTVVEAKPCDDLKVEGPRADEVKERLSSLGFKGCVKILNSPPPHVGLGSTTQLLLSSAKALALINGVEMNAQELAELVGRGGTSGIGVRVFESGGFIIDFGHSLKLKGKLLPSGASLTSPPPTLKINFPEDWRIIMAYPKEGGKYDEKNEVKVFLEKTPLEQQECDRVARIIYMMLIPSVITKDLSLFQRAVNMIQQIGFKRVENEIQSPEVKKLIEKVREITGMAGLSSMGPLVYTVVHKDVVRIMKKRVAEIVPEGFEVIAAPPDNYGARVG